MTTPGSRIQYTFSFRVPANGTPTPTLPTGKKRYADPVTVTVEAFLSTTPGSVTHPSVVKITTGRYRTTVLFTLPGVWQVIVTGAGNGVDKTTAFSVTVDPLPTPTGTPSTTP